MAVGVSAIRGLNIHPNLSMRLMRSCLPKVRVCIKLPLALSMPELSNQAIFALPRMAKRLFG
jgi:hypothetical protein